jgi:drug/metabolite transporter (DMT)-like permease
VKRHPLLYAALAVGVGAISTAAVFIKRCDDASPAVIAAARLGIAAALLPPICRLTRGRWAMALPRHCVWPVALAGLFLGAHFFFWITSLRHTSVLSSVVIVTTNPVFVGIASMLLLKERLGGRLIGAIVLAAAGGAVIALSDRRSDPGTLYGNFMSLCGAVMASCYLLMGRRVRREVDVLAYILPVYGIAAGVLCLAAAVVAWSRGEDVLGYRSGTYVYFVLLAVVPQLVGHSALNWALRHATATLVAVCILGEPIGATVLAWWLLDERIGGWQAAGGALILGGIYLAARQGER